MSEFLTVFTRACQRPEALRRCIDSVLDQSFDNWRQIIVVDNQRRGLKWANERFDVYRWLPRGEFVYHLDDDGVIEDSNFFSHLYTKAITHHPDVILCRSLQNGELLPPDYTWDLDWEGGERTPFWVGSGYCYAVKLELWRANVWRYHRGQGDSWSTGGDWRFMQRLITIGADLNFVRLDAQGASGRRSRAKKFETRKDGWFPPIVEEYGLEMIEPDVWVLDGRIRLDS